MKLEAKQQRANYEKEAQSYCDSFRQTGVELNDGTYNKWFSIQNLSEEVKPVFSRLTF